MQETELAALVERHLAEHGLELDSLDVTPVGKRRVVRITVDGDGPQGRGPLLDDISAAASRISRSLDESDVLGEAPYTLEVTSRGVSTPLTDPKHYRRNTGRLVRLWLADDEVEGRIRGMADDDTLDLDVDGQPTQVSLDDVRKAVVQVELNRKDADAEEVE